jgi:hypothetical protein
MARSSLDLPATMNITLSLSLSHNGTRRNIMWLSFLIFIYWFLWIIFIFWVARLMIHHIILWCGLTNFCIKKNWTRGGMTAPGRCFKKKMIFSCRSRKSPNFYPTCTWRHLHLCELGPGLAACFGV